MEPLVERNYTAMGDKTSTNLRGTTHGIPHEDYERMDTLIKMYSQPAVGRFLGTVHDETKYYNFQGSNVLFPHGLVQAGTAQTADNHKGFRMTRLFANSLDDMAALERECGLQR